MGYKVKRILTWINERRLPVEYQEVEYIQSSGSQRIDTGIRPNDNTYGFECKFNITGFSSDGNVMNLGKSSTDDYRYGFGYSGIPNDPNWQAGNPGASGWVTIGDSGLVLNTDFVGKYNYNGDLKFYINDTQKATLLSGGQTFNVNWNIFCQAYGSGTYTRYMIGKLYYMKIYHGTTLLRDFIPCYRKSDSVIGLYDLVNDTFYTNAGSGTFTKGSDVPDFIEKQIYPAGWKPNANTIAYYPLDSTNTINDLSGNNHTLSAIGITYNNNYAILSNSNTGGSYFSVSSLSLPSTIYIGAWIYNTSFPSGRPRIIAPDGQRSATVCIGSSNGALSYIQCGEYFGGSTDAEGTVDTPMTYGSWKYVYYTGVIGTSSQCGFVSSTGLHQYFIGTNYKAPYWNGGATSWIIGTNGASSYRTNDSFRGYISNLIIENKKWSNDEIMNYFNQTKSNYGL